MNTILMVRNKAGKYVCKKSYLKPLMFAVVVFTIVGGTIRSYQLNHAPQVKFEPTLASVAPNPCLKTKEATSSTPAHYDCGDQSDVTKKWEQFVEDEHEKQVEELKRKAGEPAAILSYTCRKVGVNDGLCPKVLRAIATVESGFGKNMVGDSGKSIGWFQIHRGFHPTVSKSCALDLGCSAEWTLKRLVAKGYFSNLDSAIRAHNGSPTSTVTLAYLKAVKSHL